MTDTNSSSEFDGARGARFESIVDRMADGVFVVDSDGTISFVNRTVEAFTGVDRQTLVGSTFEQLCRSGLFGRHTYETFSHEIEHLRDGNDTERQLTIETADGSRMLELRLAAVDSEESETDIVGTVRDVTDRERAVESLDRQQTVLYQLHNITTEKNLAFEKAIKRVLEIGCDFLDLPYGFLTRIDGENHQMVHVVDDSDTIQEGHEMPLNRTYCKRTVESDDVVTMQDTRTAVGEADPAYTSAMSCYAGTKIIVGNNLYGTFCFGAPDARDRTFTDNERRFVQLLGTWASHQIERERFESRLRGLHEVGQELLLAETAESVAAIAVESSEELFGLPLTAYWQYEESSDTLQPIAETETCLETIGETPTFARGSGLVWESFDSGEIHTYEETNTEAAVYNPETKLHSEVHVPIGERSILISGSTRPHDFDETDIESLRLLGGLVEAAMVSVRRRKEVLERGEALQEQNERLEEFSRVVAHDLRNPLAGAVGFLEIARETGHPDHFDRVEGSLDRMEALIDELLDIARGARRAVDPRNISLDAVVGEAWSYLDAPEARLQIAGSLDRIDADETRLLQLFGNLFRNSVEHVGPDVTVTVGPLESGFYVDDDGPSLPDNIRSDVLMFGKTTSATGTGIGLSSVTDIIDAHGWELSIPETERGARFEIRTE